MASSLVPASVQGKLAAALPRNLHNAAFAVLNFDLIRNIVFLLFILRYTRKTFDSLRGYGVVGSLKNVFAVVRLWCFSLFLRAPGVRSQVDKQITTALTKLEDKMLQKGPGVTRYLALPKEGWTEEKIRTELQSLAGMDHAKWEDGRVSGAVYHGGEDLLKLQTEAIGTFSVSNPLHPDVFPGVRKMEAEIVAMVLALFHSPTDGAGVTTSGGTESILMACLAARQKGYSERGITEPEMVVPETVHAAFFKAGGYFGIKVHRVPCPAPDYKVHIPSVRRLINRNTVLIVGSAPNFPHGIVDDIPALSRLAVSYKLPLHVDCCLGSFIIAFLKKAGFPSPYEDEGGFDFRQPGVTSISVDTHKYGFAPKGNSVLLYRNRTYRNHQYFIFPDWVGGVYASPSIAGSRPGALIAGCWASLMTIGESGYIASCHQIVGAAKKFENAIREDPILSSNLEVIGYPDVSVVAFASKNEGIDTYDIADGMAEKGWHLNALQDPPAIHVAFTRPTAISVDKLQTELTEIVKQELEKAEERKKQGKSYARKRGDTAALYGVAGSLPDKSIVSRLAEGFLDALYKS
ncbi:putative sphinganine-1-phosphate aldolase BST1 [Talaromyces proteolyticus]|uniref:sphinganine-1-phosphate aldolase n=1 Tax=Talaromyces proteolyticus TaxID=1131652 RepID=A0AAD4Q0W2_9EURO|nr:putative sphinganine-1-phosphate aldolase BST1 [Talaromyces proteolyticus]KAH8697711.1 putative sphinganine-1-phosphate aldolase BST1 [Talaromyces proteolyticus]